MVKSFSRNNLIQLALGLFLLVIGISGIQHDNSFFTALGKIAGKNSTLNLIIAILELAGGVFLLLSFFTPIPATGTLLFILMIIWICIIAYVNIYCQILAGKFKFMPWAQSFSLNLLVLSAIIQVRRE